MDGKKHKITVETVSAVLKRAAKYPGNDWAKQIILVCDYANEQLYKASKSERVENEGHSRTLGRYTTKDEPNSEGS